MSVSRLRYLFQRYVDKTCTPGEKEEFLFMVRQTAYHNEVQALLDENWEQPWDSNRLDEEKAERIFNHIVNTSKLDDSVPSYRIIKSVWFRVAAAVFIISGIATLFFIKQSAVPAQAPQVSINRHKQLKPERRIINLPDGSTVILNANSKLTFTNDFRTSREREVYLVGEAYFDIKHNADRPFIVHTGKLKTTVLGTAFDVKAYPGDEAISVTVRRGRVKVSDPAHTYGVIIPDEQIVYNKNLDQHVKTQVKSASLVAWKNEDLYFDDVTMESVAGQLKERFNVNINFSNEAIKNCRFSATFLKSQSLEQILNVISEFNKISYQFQDKRSVLLAGKGCEVEPAADKPDTEENGR